MNKKIRNVIWTLAFIAGFAGMIIGIDAWHAAHCPVCQDKEHVEHCSKLSYHDKGIYDQQHGCSWFWCDHYNGK